MAFTEAEEKELINLIAKNPILYDPNDDGYHNLFVKESTWSAIGRELQKPAEECKRKWKFIRDGYTRYKKKCRGDMPPKNAKSKRHEMLIFLESCQLIPTPEPEVQIDVLDDASQETFEAQYEFGEEKKIDEDIPLSKIKKEIEDNKSTPRRKKRQWKYDNIIVTIEKEDSLEMDDTNVRKREDDVDLFCRHIAEVLRNLPPLYKAQAKKNISAVVSDYEIKAAQPGTTSDTESKD